MRILISGGGTGGHVYPALAVARELRASTGAELLFLGDANGLETRIVPEAGIPFVAITAGKLPRYLSATTLRDLGRVPIGMAQARRVVARFQPDAAFTSGGYVSVPAGIAARLSGAPLLMHQQDVPPNLANRMLTPFATRISVSFPASLPYFPRGKTALAGNPVRAELLEMLSADPLSLRRQFVMDPQLPLLLVTGGSQGARHLNQVIVAALPELLRRCQVLHISGTLTYEETRAEAERFLDTQPELRARYALHAYLDLQMPAALAASDLVFCRAGAATLAELAILGKPSVLVPLPPGFTGSPQAVNAEMFRAAGAANVLLDKDLSPQRLSKVLYPLLASTGQRVLMGKAARSLAHPQAAATLAQAVAELAASRSRSR